MLVSGWQQALTLVAVLVPGFVYQGVRRNRVGPSLEDRDLSARLIRALVVSVVFVLVYLVCLGSHLTDRLFARPEHRLDDPRLVGLLGLVLVFILPAVVGHVSASFTTRRRYNLTTFRQTLFEKADSSAGELTWRMALLSNESDYSPIPTAWDFATDRIIPGSFIRVLNPDGLWLGGRVTGDAFFTGYPEPRDIYVDQAWSLAADGTFEAALAGPTGAWIPCVDAALVQIIPPPDVAAEDS